MPVIYQKFIRRNDLIQNRDKLYLFGDNVARYGSGGQAAEMRGESNAIGIRVKNAPGYSPEDFWTDRTFEKNTQMIHDDMEPIVSFLFRGGTVVIPEDGIGTGRARMKETCPDTFRYLSNRLQELESYH